VKGIEPSSGLLRDAPIKQVPDSATSEHTQIRAQIADAPGCELLQVVAAWTELSAPLKAAILAIVQSSGAATEDKAR
jgi:hypothetical protein